MKRTLSAAPGPAPPGPFSPGLQVGEWIFLSGQGGFDPATGELVDGGIVAQTDQTFRNIEAILHDAGASLEDIVACLVHLSDLGLWHEFNYAYLRHFPGTRPVRTTVGADLVLGMLVEVTVIAHRAPARGYCEFR